MAASTTVRMGSQYPTPVSLSFVAMNSDTMPGYLSAITDSTWGTRHRRITDVDLQRPGYSTNQAWSKDGTWLYLPGRSSSSLRRLRNGRTYADLGAVTTLPQQIIWSNTDDNRGYGIHQSLMRIYTWNPNSPSTQTQIADFSATGGARRADQPADWTAIEAGGVWNISIDDHLVGFWATRGDGTWDAVAYDPVDDRIEAYLNVAVVPTAVVVSISGTYIIVDRGSTRYFYTMTARVGSTPGTFTFVRSYDITGSSHGLPGVDHASRDIFIRAGGLGTMQRMDNGDITTLVPANTCVSGGHAGYAINRPGHVYWSVDYVGSDVTEPGYGLLLATPTNLGTLPPVEVYGCHHNMVTGGGTVDDTRRLHMAPNRAGDLVIWGGDWHGGGAYSGNTNGFVSGMNA